MSDMHAQAIEWVVRQAARPLEAHEQAAFEAWYHAHPAHAGAYLRARAIERSLEKLTLEEGQRPSQETVHDGLDARGFRHAHDRRRFVAAGALAAGVAALGVSVGWPLLSGATVLKTAKGELRKVPLADSSVVTLNGASRVDVRLGGRERRIALVQGEAWFEVAKDKTRPFVVAAGDVVVRAVGTAFAVRRRDGGADVLVTEGVVEVWTEQGGATPARLAAGEHAWVPDRATRIAAALDPAETERRLAWRDGKLVLRGETLAAAAAEFNRYNARAIVIRDARLGQRTFVGQYRIDQPERFADDVRVLLGVPVALRPDAIEIGARR